MKIFYEFLLSLISLITYFIPLIVYFIYLFFTKSLRENIRSVIMLVVVSILFPMVVVSIFEGKPFFNILDYINVVGIALKQSVYNLLYNKFTFDFLSPDPFFPGVVSEPFLVVPGLVTVYIALIAFYFLMKRVTTIENKKAFNILARKYYVLLILPFFLLMWFVELLGLKLFYPYIPYIIDVIVIVDVVPMMKNGISQIGIGKMRGRFTDFYVFFLLGYLLLELISPKLLLNLFLLRLVSNEYLNLMILGFFYLFITFIFYLSYVFFIIPLAEILFDEKNHGSSFF